jgi:hypothetical protein
MSKPTFIALSLLGLVLFIVAVILTKGAALLLLSFGVLFWAVYFMLDVAYDLFIKDDK